MINGIAHNALKVVDMEKTLHFYCNVVGFKKAFEINDDENRPWIVYLKIADGQFVELFYGGEADAARKYAPDLIGYNHFCIETDDIDALAKQFHKQGLIERPEASRGRDLNRHLWIHDPDGNAVEFVQYDIAKMHRGIGHMAFVVSDMSAALRFYRDILGFEIAKELQDENNLPWIVYLHVKNGQYIELFYNGSRKNPPSDKAAGFMHMCIEVRDINEITAHLEKNNVKIDSYPSRGKSLNYQCWARDPDGNKIEFMQMDMRSPQMNS